HVTAKFQASAAISTMGDDRSARRRPTFGLPTPPTNVPPTARRCTVALIPLVSERTSMRHVLNRSDFEDLYGPQSYPKRTRAAAAELVTRGLKANAGTLDHLASKGVVAVPRNDAGRRLWERRHI